MKISGKFILKVAGTLTVISLVVAALLGLVDNVTADKIAAIDAENTRIAMSAVAPEGSEFGDKLDITDDMTAAAASQGGKLVELYPMTTAGADNGYVMKISASGSQGSIVMMVETNLPEASIQWLCSHCTAPVLADPVSTIKAPKLLPVLDKLTALKPNRMEAELLSGVTIRDEADVQKAAKVLLDKGVQQVYISLGSDGLYAEDQAGRHVRLPCPKVQVVNATGGGDAMAAALAACIAHGKPLAECARKAAGAGALACTAAETIHPGMSWENVDYILDNTGMSKKA